MGPPSSTTNGVGDDNDDNDDNNDNDDNDDNDDGDENDCNIGVSEEMPGYWMTR